MWQERLERLSAPQPDSWTPPIDVYETEDRYVVAAELPGLARDHIELKLEDSRLTIRGQRTDRAASGGEVLHFHQVERGHGAFTRTFEFAGKIDVDARVRRPDQRRADGHAAEDAGAAAPHD